MREGVALRLPGERRGPSRGRNSIPVRAGMTDNHA